MLGGFNSVDVWGENTFQNSGLFLHVILVALIVNLSLLSPLGDPVLTAFFDIDFSPCIFNVAERLLSDHVGPDRLQRDLILRVGWIMEDQYILSSLGRLSSAAELTVDVVEDFVC